jgi:methylthioribose-1-phosphate isomerase
MPDDPTRREFFRTFSRETVRNAGAVASAAAEIRRASGAAARELLEIGGPGVEVRQAVTASSNEPVAAFNSAYRRSDAALLILDQRELPDRVSILTCHEPSEVASAIRLGVVNAGPVTGELAAYAMALAAAASPGDLVGLDHALRAAANTLRGARRDVHALSAAVERMEARYAELTADTDAADRRTIAAALREEADAVTTEAQLSHAGLGRAGAERISGAVGRPAAIAEPLNLLMHGDMGPLSCGMVGTGTAILQSLIDSGRNVHVWVTDAAPTTEGARIAALQLTQMDVPHTVIPDTAASWLLSNRRLDLALLRGDTVATNGETLAPIGSLNVGQLAAQAGVPVYVVAPPSSFAAPGVDPTSLLFDLRSPAESGIRKAGGGVGQPPTVENRLAPTTDLVPARLVTAFLTESGMRPMGTA